MDKGKIYPRLGFKDENIFCFLLFVGLIFEMKCLFNPAKNKKVISK